MKTKTKTATMFLAALVLLGACTVQADIIGISKPVGSNDGSSRPSTAAVWNVSVPPYPFNTNLGIGYTINSSFTAFNYSDFCFHDHVYLSPRIPQPTRAVITYNFDQPTVVKSVKLVLHQNGVTQIEGFIGDSTNSMISIGSVFGNKGDLTAIPSFAEGEENVFTFTNTTPARYFRFVVRKTSHSSGYAVYRAFLYDLSDTVIAPAQVAPFVVTIAFSDVDVCWPSSSNKVYQVEYKSSLTAGEWLPVGSEVQGNGTTNCITDSIRGQPQKFYRVTSVP